MLRRTFLHISGIGEVTERRIWDMGLRTWDDFMAAAGSRDFHEKKLSEALPDVQQSVEHFAAGNWKFFDHLLASHHKWRAFGDLSDQALYVDIETTGMMGDDAITVIGTYDGREAKAFVAGVNLEDAADEIERHPLIVTYNGAQFDMPMIRAKFRYNFFNHIHVDLRFPLRRLGLKGGLKKIEQAMGIERSERTRGLDGWDAVRLWREYEEGHDQALDLLVAYNQEDIRNLQPLMEHVFNQMSQECTSHDVIRTGEILAC